MAKVRCVYPYGDAYTVIPQTGRVIEAKHGEIVTVTKEEAEILLAQPQNYEPADKEN